MNCQHRVNAGRRCKEQLLGNAIHNSRAAHLFLYFFLLSFVYSFFRSFLCSISSTFFLSTSSTFFFQFPWLILSFFLSFFLCTISAFASVQLSPSLFWVVTWRYMAGGRQHRRCIIPQAVTHSLVLLKMGKIISRNMLS